MYESLAQYITYIGCLRNEHGRNDTILCELGQEHGYTMTALIIQGNFRMTLHRNVYVNKYDKYYTTRRLSKPISKLDINHTLSVMDLIKFAINQKKKPENT